LGSIQRPLLREGTEYVKKYITNTLTQEYDVLLMEEDDHITYMKMRFTYIVNKLQNFGNITSSANIVLRFMIRDR